jgi:hypothetical protein
MKKTFLIAAVLVGAASVSQAGVRLGFGFSIPLGPPPVVYQAPPVYTVPAPVYTSPAPVYQAPPVVYAAPSVVYAPPVAYAPASSVYLGFGHGWYGPRYYHGGYRGGWGYHHGWHH